MDTTLYLIAVFLGVGAWAIADEFRKRRRARQATAVPASPPGRKAGRERETPTQALHRLAANIETFVEDSSHPRELLDHPDFKAAVEILGGADVSFDLLRQYATGANWALSCAAYDILSRRPGRDQLQTTVLGQLAQMRPWAIYFALRFLNSLESRPAVGAPAAKAQNWWHTNVVITDAFREYFVERDKLGDAVAFGTALDTTDRGETSSIDWLLYRVDHPSAETLRVELRQWSRLRIDRAFLSSFGRFWERAQDDRLLIVPDAWRARLEEASAAILKSEPHRSVLVSGEPRVGKTSFLKLLSHLLEEEGWSVFEASAAELMAGQSYFGELEGRIRKMIEELNSEKKVAWYVPDLLQLAESGTHRGQSSSILDQVSQAIGSGKLVLLAEASPAGVVRLFQTRPSMRGAMELLRFEPMGEAETAELVRDVASQIEPTLDVVVDDGAIDAVLQLSHQYLGSALLPGATIDLLKRAANHALSAGAAAVDADDVLETLSQTTGLPRSVLDDDQRLDLESVRRHFAKRVIGQNEAVTAVIDRIAMLKAGLVDPKRPIGVFLFAGPTGTGKTELAKTLASYLFGSPDRMARLDMSELQTAESTAKILGTGQTDSLAEKVRKQPFSVVLLDEFEKAHSNAWDLFLQVFDDGRLTDAAGRVVDFRHTFIILTTNLGATAHAGPAFGFGAREGAWSNDQILKAVSATFRPEFINRLDRVIVFRPLSREFMRDILEKELALVLERRGLRQREWAVEYEDSAVNFLLDKGFTADMGARPLRRAIDEYLLSPLAATMVEHRYPAGDQFLFVRSDGHAIQVEFVDPDKDAPAAAPAAAPGDDRDVVVARAVLSATGSEAEMRALGLAANAIDAELDSEVWRAKKNELALAIGDPGIWQKNDRAQIFSQYEVMDRVLEARRTADRLKSRLEGTLTSKGKVSRELVSRLALQLRLVRFGIEDALAPSPIDAIVAVEPVASATGSGGDEAQDWCARVLGMYRNWARLRHMRLREIAAHGKNGLPVLDIAGFGAFRVLAEEAGLHVLEEGDGRRAAARVRVSPGLLGDGIRPDSPEEQQAVLQLLSRTADDTSIVRRYRTGPDKLVRDARKGWRSGRLGDVLAGNFDIIGMMGD